VIDFSTLILLLRFPNQHLAVNSVIHNRECIPKSSSTFLDKACLSSREFDVHYQMFSLCRDAQYFQRFDRQCPSLLDSRDLYRRYKVLSCTEMLEVPALQHTEHTIADFRRVRSEVQRPKFVLRCLRLPALLKPIADECCSYESSILDTKCFDCIETLLFPALWGKGLRLRNSRQSDPRLEVPSLHGDADYSRCFNEICLLLSGK
jgi:hypothetical protein